MGPRAPHMGARLSALPSRVRIFSSLTQVPACSVQYMREYMDYVSALNKNTCNYRPLLEKMLAFEPTDRITMPQALQMLVAMDS